MSIDTTKDYKTYDPTCYIYNVSTNQEMRDYYINVLPIVIDCIPELKIDVFPTDIAKLIADYLVIKKNKGDKIECLDPFDRWYVCTIIKEKPPNRIFVHYCGWSLRWDEWLNLEPDQQNSRVAEIGENTDGTPHSCQHTHCQSARQGLLKKLVEMSFDEEVCAKTLLQVGPDLERIINWILDYQEKQDIKLLKYEDCCGDIEEYKMMD